MQGFGRRTLWLLALGGTLALAACDGGGTGVTPAPTPTPTVTPSPTPTPTPTPTSRLLTFSSPSTVDVVEKKGADSPFYSPRVVNPEDGPLTYSITGGADAGFFKITGSDYRLVWSANTPSGSDGAPSYWAHADANADNIYEVQITANGPRNGVGVLDLKVRLTSLGTPTIDMNFVPGTPLNQPTAAVDAGWVGSGGGGYFEVSEKGGLVRARWISNFTVVDLRTVVSTDGDRGLLGFTSSSERDPRFLLYTNLAGDIEIRRFSWLATQTTQMPSAGVPIITIPHPRNTNIGGWIGFNPKDGYLYIATGDGGAPGAVVNTAQDPNSLLGKVLRIDVNRDDFPSDATRNYGIPADNPFATSGGKPEIWAMGLRDPTGGSFYNGALLIADRGESQREEVDMIPLGRAGLNFGWPVMEGTLVRSGTPLPSFTPPVIEYAHGAGVFEGNSIVGGLIPDFGGGVMQDNYLFADRITGNIWTVYPSQLRLGTTLSASQFIRRNGDFPPTSSGAVDHPVVFMNNFPALVIVNANGNSFIAL